MKKQKIAAILGITIGAMWVSGCASTQNKEYAGETVYGEVSEVGTNSVTIELGTQKEMEKPEDATDTTDSGTAEQSEESKSADGDKADGEKTDGEAPSMLDLTGETLKVTVSSDTEIVSSGMAGGPGGAPGGEAPSGEAPEKPDGEEPSGEKPDGEPPEKPDGDDSEQSEDKGSKDSDSDKNAESQEEDLELSDLSEGDIISVAYDEDGNVEKITVLHSADGMGQQGQVESYDAATEITTDTEEKGKTYESDGTDENAIHVYEGANATLKKITVTRTSSDSQGGDSSSFYGVGAAVLTTDGTTTISDSTIETDAKGGAGVFSYGDGTTYVSDTKITTQQDTSGGIHVAGGGTLYAWDLDVETNRESSAAIRSDRGGGMMVVDGGTYTSNGTGSPAVYTTADIAIHDADLEATSSEAVCIEGLNTLRLYDCDLTGNMPENEQNDCEWNVILYQSMSGDSEEGNSTFEMEGGTLTAHSGGMFYTTNTESTISLEDVDITYSDDNAFFLRCTGNNNARGWGESGKNGADCLFTARNQEMEGDVIWDSISQLDFYMLDGSTLTGAVTQDETYAGNGGDGYCNLTIEKGSTWVVTGNSTLSTLANEGTIADANGNTVTIVGEDGTVYVNGTSEYTVTVKSYGSTADTSGAATNDSWSDHEVTTAE